MVADRILAAVEDARPRFVGLSIFPGERSEALALAGNIKRRFPGVRIVGGGTLPSLAPGSLVFRGSPVDVLVRGDGEVPCRMLAEGAAWGSIPGICWLDGEKILDSGIHHFHERIDYVPSYQKIDMSYYCFPNTDTLRPYYVRGARVFSSIGCPFSCHFCANPRRRIKFKDLDVLIGEIRLLKDVYHINGLLFNDDCFLIDRNRTIDFCKQYQASRIGVPWGIQTRANLLTDELAASLRDAGCVQVCFGVESGSDTVLQTVNKGIRVEETLRAFRLCRKLGIKTFANMMFNMPGETEQDVEQSLAFIKAARPTHVAFSLTVPLLGTKIYEEYVKPPLSYEEYGVFASNEPYVRIVDDRFRLAKHSLNLDRLLANVSLRYYFKTSFGLVGLSDWYLRKVLPTTRLDELLIAIAAKVFVQVRSYLRGMVRLCLPKNPPSLP